MPFYLATLTLTHSTTEFQEPAISLLFPYPKPILFEDQCCGELTSDIDTFRASYMDVTDRLNETVSGVHLTLCELS